MARVRETDLVERQRPRGLLRMTVIVHVRGVLLFAAGSEPRVPARLASSSYSSAIWSMERRTRSLSVWSAIYRASCARAIQCAESCRMRDIATRMAILVSFGKRPKSFAAGPIGEA